MSYALPPTHPDSSSGRGTPDSTRRKHEEALWGSSGRSRFGANLPEGAANAASGVARKMSDVFGGDNEKLPMYKDKPYAYPISGRRRPLWKRKSIQILVLLMLVVGVMWFDVFGIRSSSGVGKTKPIGKPVGGGWTSSSSSSGSSGKKSGKGKTSGKKVDWDDRREKVKEAMEVSWDAYERYAWGFDEFHPVSKKGRQMVPDGMGWIIIDALDTLMLMNMTKQLTHAREWVSKSLSFDKDHDVNTFETTIRMLGGLLSAHYLSTEFPDMAPLNVGPGSTGEDLYLEKAVDLADRLLGAYESPTGIPYASVNLAKREGLVSHADGGASSTAEATSLQLEMKYLAKLTGEKAYWEVAEHVIKVVDDQGQRGGLLPIFVSPATGHFKDVNIRLGSRGDSYYEYLIKQYLQTSEQEPIYYDMWNQSLHGVRKHLITYSAPHNFTVLAERPGGIDKNISPKMDHLVCFMPGTIALGATKGLPLDGARQQSFWGPQQEEEMELARELMRTCWGMYKLTPTGLAGEITHFNIHDPPIMMADGPVTTFEDELYYEDERWQEDFYIKPNDVHNLQRPETVESLFYMWRITGDVKYRDWGWEMFESFKEHTQLGEGAGFTSIANVKQVPPAKRDNMESFWLAETLKYFYLLFDENNVLPLDQIVLNTEAHPLPRFEMGKLFKTGWTRKPRTEEGILLPEPIASKTTGV